MSDYNQFNIRQVGERIRLPGMSVSISEKKKDDGSTVRWVQLSKFNKKSESYENFSLFRDDLELLGLKIPDLSPPFLRVVLHMVNISESLKNLKEKAKPHMQKVALAGTAAVATVGQAAAEVGNGSIADVGPIISDAATLMPYVLLLIISTAGCIIGMAVIRFVTGLFDNILDGIKFS